MPIVGSAVYDRNFRLRFFVIIVMGIFAFAAVAFWRYELLFAAEYQDMPVTQAQLKVKKENSAKRAFLERQMEDIN